MPASFTPTKGLLGVANLRVTHPFNRLFIDACVAAGIPRNEDFNGATQEGVGYYQATQWNGLRCSAARGYLRPIWDHAKLTLMKRAFVSSHSSAQRRSLRRWSSVTTASRSWRAPVARCLLAAGTIGSPKILMLSGIGPRAELERHGITCVNDLPGVGRNLQEHPGIILSYDVDMRTMNVDAHSRWRFAMRALQFALLRRGPGTSPISHVGAFFRTRPDLPALRRADSLPAAGLRSHARQSAASRSQPCKPGSECHPAWGARLDQAALSRIRRMRLSSSTH